jgi:hypothetical protein
VLAALDPAVVEVPQLGPLVLGIPLAEVVAEGQDALLGPRALLVAAGAAERSVEAVLADRVEQRDGLQAVTSGNSCPVATCSIGNGNRPGRNAFSAMRSRTTESLPPLNSSTGRSNSAATSRMTWIASLSSASRWGSS